MGRAFILLRSTATEVACFGLITDIQTLIKGADVRTRLRTSSTTIVQRRLFVEFIIKPIVILNREYIGRIFEVAVKPW